MVALSGNSDVTVPVVNDCHDSFKAFNLDIPKWDALFKSSDMAEKFRDIEAKEGNDAKGSGMIVIPQSLTVPITILASKVAFDVGVVLPTTRSWSRPIPVPTPS
jgi:hypothetical protein